MSTILRKLSSRKLWLAVSGVATGIALILGASSTDITKVSGAVTALVSVAVYLITEGKVDAAAVAKAVESTQDAVSAVTEDKTNGG